jgi:hypothetical protein
MTIRAAAATAIAEPVNLSHMTFSLSRPSAPRTSSGANGSSRQPHAGQTTTVALRKSRRSISAADLIARPSRDSVVGRLMLQRDIIAKSGPLAEIENRATLDVYGPYKR